MRAALIAVATLLAAGISSSQDRGSGPLHVTAVRLWALDGVTRVVVEADGNFEYHTERLHNPERIFFDIFRARPDMDGKRIYSREFDDKLVRRVRVAETLPGVTRIVLDLVATAEATASRMSNPSRLVIEVRATAETLPEAPASVVPAAPREPAPTAAAQPVSAAPVLPAPAAPAKNATTATHTSDGKNSLIRALGLKLKVVVIDAGHGGHDQGTVGTHGLLEKDLVLDVAKRLGQLIQEGLGSEVIYTRTDDTFVPLEGRTELANQKKADLFISLHANSSRYARIGGVETFYLNFTSSRDALDVAARENASSQKSISELQDILQKITLQNKVEESRELARRVQASLFTFSSRYLRGEKNRGVKMAPFVVLIGAQMPAVLVEIGFLSNAREESLMNRPEHRQRVAEALFRGISRYAQGLSHFDVADAKK